jgi:hypothetical protein
MEHVCDWVEGEVWDGNQNFVFDMVTEMALFARVYV